MRKLTLVLVVLLGLLVAADVVARNVVEAKLADHIDAQESVQGTAVEIHGLSFLAQAARSNFGEVEVTFPALSTHSGFGRDLQVNDVRLTLRDLETSQRFTRAVARQVEGTGTISYAQLNDLLGVQLTFRQGTGQLDLAVPSRGASITVTPGVESTRGLVLGGLPSSYLDVLGPEGFGFSGIPNDVAVTSVEPTESGLQVRLAATDVPFAR